MNKQPQIDQQITFLYTADLLETTAFYEDVMGLSLVLDQGSCRIYRVGGDSFLGFCQREEAPDKPQGVIFTLVTTAVDVGLAAEPAPSAFSFCMANCKL